MRDAVLPSGFAKSSSICRIFRYPAREGDESGYIALKETYAYLGRLPTIICAVFWNGRNVSLGE